MPFAFTDIEMVFSEEHSAVDWIFRYGNRALAELEKRAAEQLIDHSFAASFPIWTPSGCGSMSARRSMAKLGDHRLQSGIDTELKIICFPTFPDTAAVCSLTPNDPDGAGQYIGEWTDNACGGIDASIAFV